MNILKTKTCTIPYTVSKSIHSSFDIFGVSHQVYIDYKPTKIPTIYLVNQSIIVTLPTQYKKLETSQVLHMLKEKLYDKIANKEIETVMEKTRLTLGFAPEDYCIQRLKNNAMATCNTSERKIVINPDIVKYDKRTIEYIVLHQFCHLKYKIHTKGFWKILKNYYPNYKNYEENLLNAYVHY